MYKNCILIHYGRKDKKYQLEINVNSVKKIKKIKTNYIEELSNNLEIFSSSNWFLYKS